MVSPAVSRVSLGFDLLHPFFGYVLLDRSVEDLVDLGFDLTGVVIEAPDGFETLFG